MKLNGLIILGAALMLAPLSAEAIVSKASLSVAPKAKKDSVAIMKEKAEREMLLPKIKWVFGIM